MSDKIEDERAAVALAQGSVATFLIGAWTRVDNIAESAGVSPFAVESVLGCLAEGLPPELKDIVDEAVGNIHARKAV